MKGHQRNYAILHLLYEILTKTSKYIKPPLKLSDTDHAPNVADITNRLVDLLTKGGKELHSKGLKLITIHSKSSNASFQDFISNIKLEDLYLGQPLANADADANETSIATTAEANANANANATSEIDAHIKLSNNTAGRQLLNSIEKEHSNIHSLLEIENTNAVSVFEILIELFKQVDIINFKLDIQYKMHNILDISDKQYIQDSTLLPVKKKFLFLYWFAFDSNVNYIPLWMKNFQSFMTPVHSHAFREWESDVNDLQSDFGEPAFEVSREKAFKKFITSIKTKTVFSFKPVGPFMERKRPQESTPKNQNQNQNQNQDKRPKVASKKVACSMCKERKNIESYHPENKCFWFIRDENGNIIENPEGEAKRKAYFDKKKNTSNKPYSVPTVLLSNIPNSNDENYIYSEKSNIYLLDSCANIPIVRKPVSNAISCDVHINTLELKSSVHSKSFGITHVIAIDTNLKPVKIIFKAYYIPSYSLTMEENFNVLPAYHFCKINRKNGTSPDPQFKIDGIESTFSLIATDNSVVHFKTDLHNQMPILSPVPNMDAITSDYMRVVDLKENLQTPNNPQIYKLSKQKSSELLAMQIHQQFGHAPFQKIKLSLGNKNLHRSVEAPISVISQSVLHELQNLHCEDCQLAKKNQIQHPQSSKIRRSNIPFQIVYVDMCYNPYYSDIKVNKKSSTSEKMLKKHIFSVVQSFSDSRYLIQTAYNCPFALVFVDETTRWKEVIPLEDKTITSYIKGFLYFRNRVIEAMAKLQSNPNVINKTNLNIPIEDIKKMNPNNITFEIFKFDFPIQTIRTDQESAIESSVFQDFIKNYWNFNTIEEKPVTDDDIIDVKSFIEKNQNRRSSNIILKFKSATMQTVPTNQHQFNGIAERAIRTIKEKAAQNYETAFKSFNNKDKKDAITLWWFWSMHYAATISNLLPISVNNKIEPSPYFQISGKTIHANQLIPFWDTGYAIILDHAKKKGHNMRHESREEVRYLTSFLLGKLPYPVHLKWVTYNQYIKNETPITQSIMQQLIVKHTDTNYTYDTFAKSSNSNQNSEDIEEILVNDGRTELELETDSLEDDLSNTETPEDGQQIGCVELLNSDSVQHEAIPANVMYVESDDIGDSGMVNICFGDDDDLTELNEFELDTVLIDDSTCGLYETTAEDNYTKLNRLPEDEAMKYYCFATSRQSSDDTLKPQMTLNQFSQHQIKAAVDKELQGILDQKVMHEVNLPYQQIKNLKILSLRMLVTVKQDNTLKARLVARGFLQREGINYFQTYSPVIRTASSRLLIQIAAITGKPIRQLDVKQAFLQAKIEEDVYVRYNNKIYKLEKALYGTKQASRAWNKTITEGLIAYGCYQCKYDRCMFIKRCPDNKKFQLIMAVSTDDVIIVADESNWHQLLNFISAEHGGLFKLSQHGPCTTFNGIEIKIDPQNRHKISMNQNTHTRLAIQKLCDKFKLHCISERKNLPDYKMKTPLSERDKQLCNEAEIKEYQSIVGALIWIATQTRPDLLHFAQNAARASKNPNIIQLQKVRESIGYLKANPEMSIVYDGENIDELRLIAYSDSDHRSRSIFTQTIPEDDTKRNRSTSGYVIMAGSGAIAYNAKLQSRVVPSSKDAEFNAAYLCIQHMKKLQGLLKELGYPQTKTILFMDNLPCIRTFVGDNDGHLDFSSDALELDMIREAKQNNELYPISIRGTENIADVFTKANAPNFSQIISFITGNKLSAVKMQEHHFELIKKGYVGSLSSANFPIFTELKQHLLTQHKIEEIQLPKQLPTVNIEAQTQKEQKTKNNKKRKYKRKNKNKNETSAYVRSMLTSENQHSIGS